MKLPNGDRAVVDIRKLQDYCLSRAHWRGRHKARVFQAALGLTVSDAELLENALLEAAKTADVAQPGEQDAYGRRFVLDFLMSRMRRQATLRSCWIIRTREDVPRLTSCYVL